MSAISSTVHVRVPRSLWEAGGDRLGTFLVVEAQRGLDRLNTRMPPGEYPSLHHVEIELFEAAEADTDA